MKRYTRIIGFAMCFAMLLCIGSHSLDFHADKNGKYTIEIQGLIPEKQYAIIIVAGDYTEKEMPEITEENLIYINQLSTDADGILLLSDFIPMTESFGTVYLGGGDTPESPGVLTNSNGYGFIGGRIISYTGEDEQLFIPENFEEISDGAFDNAPNLKRVYIPKYITSISKGAITSGVEFIFSPRVTDAVKTFAIENGYTGYVLGDFNSDMAVDGKDLNEALLYFAKEGASPDNSTSYFDLNFDSVVNLKDVSVLLAFLGNVIADFFGI